jgi:hypothetical protein
MEINSSHSSWLIPVVKKVIERKEMAVFFPLQVG